MFSMNYPDLAEETSCKTLEIYPNFRRDSLHSFTWTYLINYLNQEFQIEQCLKMTSSEMSNRNVVRA